MKTKGILSCLLFFVGLSSIFGQRLKSTTEWEKLFLQDKILNYDLDNTLSNSSDSWSYYKIAYSLDAHVSMFQATGKLEYLDRALELVNNMINSASPSFKLPKSQFKDKYLGWANHSNEELGDDGKEYPLYESFCWRYVTTLLRIMNSSKTIMGNKKYYNQYVGILKFTEKHIFEKWYSRGKGNIYRSNAHMASHWAKISLDLWMITKKVRYKTVYANFNESMRKQIERSGKVAGAYTWNTGWKETTKIAQIMGEVKHAIPLEIQDVSHGNAVVGYMIESYELGIYFNKTDINSLLTTFNKLILKDGHGSAKYINGTGDGGSGRFVDGFMKLGRYDRNIQKRLENYVFGSNSVYNRRDQFYATGCLNARILISGKSVFPN